jgi:hypothetical protein
MRTLDGKLVLLPNLGSGNPVVVEVAARRALNAMV